MRRPSCCSGADITERSEPMEQKSGLGKAPSSPMELPFQMGQILLENGAEISRVQETMERTARACDIEGFDVYVLTNSIFVTATQDGVSRSTTFRYVPGTTVHLGRIMAVNQLSREIAEGRHTSEEAFARLEDIRAIPYSPLPARVLCCALGSAAFSFLFGGSPVDSVVAFFCGIVLELFLHLAGKRNMSKFLVNLSSSALVTLCGAAFFLLGLGDNMDKIIIGSIIRLVPGVALTNSIRDFISGDYLSGAIRMLDAFLVGGCIAVGVGFVIKALSVLTGGVLL